MSNQTAVEWFASELSGHLGPSNGPELLEIFEQAKAMEKEQIMDAHEKAYIDMNLSFRSADRAEEYYNETYGK
jgi:hypothetical protein